MHDIPKLSIIIPVFNAAKYLIQCLDSVVNQSMRDLEVICVDDGSTDGSLDILKEYQQKDSRIIVSKQQNMHAGIARNNGLSLSKGEYIHFLDADDWVEPNVYRKWYAIAKDKELDVCLCFHNRYDNETGEIIKRGRTLDGRYLSESNLNKDPRYFIYNAVVPWNKIYRREHLIKNEILFDDLICVNDIAFYYRVLLHTDRIGILQEYWINYRTNNSKSLAGQDTRLLNYDCQLHALDTILKLVEYCEEPIRQMVLDVGINDLMNFYHRAIGSNMELIIRGKLCDYLRKIDVSIFGCDIYKMKWYKEYLDITYFNELSEVIVRRSFEQKEKEYNKQLKQLTKENEKYRKEINSLRATVETLQLSISFRIGRISTYPLRKLRDFTKHIFGNVIHVHTIKLFLRTIFPVKTSFVERNKHGTNSESHLEMNSPVVPWGLSLETRDPKIIISLTSFPDRIGSVHLGIRTLLNQTLKPDMLILWLARDQFPSQEAELPIELLELRKSGLLIYWCEDLKSYKKLIPALKMFPNDIIVTADDDLYYPINWLELLYSSYVNETCIYVHCHRNTRFFCPNNEWHAIFAGLSVYTHPSYLHKLGGGSGTLFPPHALDNDVLREDLFMQLAPTNDDIWFWLMAVKNNIKTKVVEGCITILSYIEDTQNGPTLYSINNLNGDLFWQDFYRVINYFPELDSMLRFEYIRMQKVERQERVSKTIKHAGYFLDLPSDLLSIELMLWYHDVTNMHLDLDNPRTFNEKIQWLKLFDNADIKMRLVDKYRVREWVKDKIGSDFLIPLLGVWNAFDEIDLNALPQRFVLKTYRGCNQYVIVSDKHSFDWEDVKERFGIWMHQGFGFSEGLELHCRNISPLIVAERFIDGISNQGDFRFLCFMGEVKYILVDTKCNVDYRRDVFDSKWNHQPSVIHYPNADVIPDRPKELSRMIDLVYTLCQGFLCVRVDLFNIGSKIYFNKMSFFPGNGIDNITPVEFALHMGESIKLPV